MPLITFHAFRVPKLFIVLFLCVAVTVWIGYRAAPRHYGASLPVTAQLPESEEEIPPAQLGQRAPDFTLMDLQGRPVSLSSYAGRPVILYFWASWCPYCIDDMPGLSALRAEHEDSGLEILAVNILEQRDKVADAAAKMNLTFPVLLDDFARVTRSFVVRATPTYILIDRDGIYRDFIVGSPRPGVLEAKLEPLLKIPAAQTLALDANRR